MEFKCYTSVLIIIHCTLTAVKVYKAVRKFRAAHSNLSVVACETVYMEISIRFI